MVSESFVELCVKYPERIIRIDVGGDKFETRDKIRDIVIKILKEREGIDVRAKRRSALYNEDKRLPLRKSHQNPYVKKVYDEFLINPGSDIAHHLLHTHYEAR